MIVDHFIAHDSIGYIEPNGCCTMVARPQSLALRPVALWCMDCGFELEEIVIGNRSQFSRAGQTLPLGLFDRMTSLAPFLECETILVAMDFCITVRNTGLTARKFLARWGCVAVDLGAWTQIVRGNTRVSARKISGDLKISGDPAIIESIEMRTPRGEACTVENPPRPVSHLDRVPGRRYPTHRDSKPPPGWGWDPHGEG